MKIVRIGKVVISENGVEVMDFTFDAEGAEGVDTNEAVNACQELALRWALRKLKDHMWELALRHL